MQSDPSPDGQRSPTFIGDARRAQIIAGAIETIAEIGIDQASLARIAERIGISKGVIVYHFGSRDELERAVIADVLARAVAYIQPRVEKASTGPQVLRTAVVSNLVFMAENRAATIALFEISVHTRSAADPAQSDVAAALRQGVSSWTELLASFQSKGEFRPDFDPTVMAIVVRAAIDSVPPRLKADPNFDIGHFADELANLLAAATQPEPGKSRKRPT